jgi:hypothetical protein
VDQETRQLWIERRDYIDLLLILKHDSIPIEQAKEIYAHTAQSISVVERNIGVRGALREWWKKKLHSEKLRNSLLGKILLKTKRKLGIKLY